VTVGLVKVLFVKVSLPARVANVPVVGSVIAVVPDTLNVVPKAPEIVSVLAELFATPVPPFAALNVPVTPVVKGKPVALVKVTLVGVPRIGVTNVGLVENTKLVDVVPVAPEAV
jgi:hypothetical protein